MNGEKPKPQKWQDIVNDIDNLIQVGEQNLLLLRAQLVEAQKHL